MEAASASNGQPNDQLTTDSTVKQKKLKLFIGQHGPSLYRPGMEIGNPMRGGLSEFHCCSASSIILISALLFGHVSKRLLCHTIVDQTRTR